MSKKRTSVLSLLTLQICRFKYQLVRFVRSEFAQCTTKTALKALKINGVVRLVRLVRPKSIHIYREYFFENLIGKFRNEIRASRA